MKSSASPIRDQYRLSNPKCEYCPYLNSKAKYHPRGSNLELDHIWGRRGPCECISNFAMACPTCHDRKTSGDMVKLARLAITWHKIKKGEFDIEELKACSGKFVPGWVAHLMDTETLSGQWLDMALDIVENEIWRKS